ncbi:hypothetical protein EJ04DRAFT_521910 [Polyplosphaeria fusca]|uniref:Uncharacterized protein n=1 Tax=Polyplosphaeria fusca TaxID=682080 RepID=A0A9P4R1P7_9PLEO|nr:hypothetical protein EJ04DRAFT_521910 [Polyplosphaeria fusca]
MSAKAASKIPLPAASPSPRAKASGPPRAPSARAAKRLSLPRPKSKGKQPGNASPLSQFPAISSPQSSTPLNRDKPLPSPPVAQVVNIHSPAKAHRTLVDATVAGTPTEEHWPVLHPDDLPSTDTHERPSLKRPLSANNPYAKLIDREYSDGSTPLPDVNVRADSTGSPASSANEDAGTISISHGEASGRVTVEHYPATAEFDSPHALSTPHGEALESPLAYKYKSRSKAASEFDENTDTSLARGGSIRLGSTRWPLLDAAENEATNPTFDTKSDFSKQAVSDGWPLGDDTYDSSSESDYERKDVSGNRVKRLSYHSLRSGLGPFLTIAEGADGIILGDPDADPAIPPLPDTDSRKSSLRSLSALAGRISRQTTSISIGKRSRSVTPQSIKTASARTRLPRITPIRSMQPSRNLSATTLSAPSSASSKKSPTVLNGKRTADDSSQPRKTAESKFLFAKPRTNSGAENTSMPDTISSVVAPRAFTPNTVTGRLGLRKRPVVPNSPITAPPEALQAAQSSALRDGSALVGENAEFLSQSIVDISVAVQQFPKPPQMAIAEPVEAAEQKTSPRPCTAEDYSTEGTHESLQKASSQQETALVVQRTTSSLSQKRLEDDGDTKGADAPRKVPRMKKSLRNLFLRRNRKMHDTGVPPNESNRMSTASSLARHFRNSTNMSKPNLPEAAGSEKEPEAISTSGRSGTQNGANQVEPASKSKLSAVSAESTSAVQAETPTLINNLIEEAKALPEGSEERMRSIRFAETVVHAIEMAHQARTSASNARKHARDAELCAEAAEYAVKGSMMVARSILDDNTLEPILELCRCAGINIDGPSRSK